MYVCKKDRKATKTATGSRKKDDLSPFRQGHDGHGHTNTDDKTGRQSQAQGLRRGEKGREEKKQKKRRRKE